MADFPTLDGQNELLTQRFANALYDTQLGSETMDRVLADIATLGSADAAFNAYYTFSFGTSTDADVAATIAGNLGVDQATQDYIEGIGRDCPRN